MGQVVVVKLFIGAVAAVVTDMAVALDGKDGGEKACKQHPGCVVDAPVGVEHAMHRLMVQRKQRVVGV